MNIRIGRMATLSLVIVGAILLSGCGAQTTPVETDSAPPTETPTEALTNSLEVQDQDLDEAYTVVVPSATSESAGWMVIHAENEGAPGPVIGFTPVSAGENQDISVELDPEGITETLYAMLHIDAGSQGEYEFPGDDAPARDGEDNVVVKPFAVSLPNINAVETLDQPLAAGNMVTVPSVTSNGAGWLVIHAAGDNGPGPVIGYSPVNAGKNSEVMVEIDPTGMTGTLFAMLHVDEGTEGNYEFPGDDVPARDSEGNVVVKPFSLTGNAVGVSNQPLVDGTNITIQSILSEGPGWIVIHQDNEGAPGPILGFAAVQEGYNNNIAVEIDGENATEVMFAMLHVDDGSQGEFEFPNGADVPARDSSENIVTPSFNLLDGSVEIEDQQLGDENSVQVPLVVAETAGWMVIHADNQGSPGAILGTAPVTAGVSEDIQVELSMDGITETVYAMLHVDAGSQGEFEFPGGADVPARDDEGAIIVSPFKLTGLAAGGGSVTSIGIRDNQFSPGDLTIKVGTTVNWQHEGSFPHTVTADGGQFDSGNLEGGDSYSFTFNEPGEYPYHCQYHGNPDGGGMAGLILVNPQ